MTLLVVDKTAFMADSYALVTANSTGRVEVMEDFPKIFALPFAIVSDQGVISYTRIGFAGCARLFLEFYKQLLRDTRGEKLIKLDRLLRYEQFKGSGVIQVVIPFPGGVWCIRYRDKQTPVFEQIEGSILAFGGDYSPVKQNGREVRRPLRIFTDALKKQQLQGPRYHVLEHSKNVDNKSPVRKIITLQ